MAAPKGNTNAAKAKVWTAAIERALAKRADERKPAIDELAATLIDKGLEGDLSALKEIGDRLEGRPAQAIDLGQNPDREAVEFNVKVHGT